MKKKTLLLSVLAVCCMGLQATELATAWTDNLALPREWGNAAGNDLAAVSGTGEVYVAGVLKGDFEFGGAFFESDFYSTYLLKYNADGSKAWAVHFNGAATPTAITVADDGTVYVAGTLADQVTMGSTDGKTQVIDGVQDFGEYVAVQAAAFAASYNADGVLLKANSYKPQKDAEDWLSAYGDDVFMNISGLQFFDGKLYAGLTVGGAYTSANGTNVGGGTFFYEDFFMNMLTRSGYVVSLDDALEFDAVVTKLSLHADMAYQAHVFNTAFAIEGSKLYVAYTSMGKQVLLAGEQAEDIVFTVTPVEDDVYYTKGYLVAEIDLQAKTLGRKALFENKPVSALQASMTVSSAKSVAVTDENVVITGVFQHELPFNNEIAAAQDTNIFVASLNKADLAVAMARSSNHSGSELWASSTVWDNMVYVAANDTANTASRKYMLDLQEPATEQPAEINENAYVNALAAQGKRMAQVEAVQEGENASLRISVLSTEPSRVDEVADLALSFYPNPVKNTLHLSKAGDMVVYNLSGVAVAQAANATQIDLRSLAPGSYILSARSSDGVRRLPFIKE